MVLSATTLEVVDTWQLMELRLKSDYPSKYLDGKLLVYTNQTKTFECFAATSFFAKGMTCVASFTNGSTLILKGDSNLVCMRFILNLTQEMMRFLKHVFKIMFRERSTSTKPHGTHR